MQGDFTRFTFQPEKHYSSVLMQQGRLQLDADWNEQMSILNYINQIQIRDVIGSAAGTSQLGGGYQIGPAIDQNSTAANQPSSDFRITEGRFYIDGILCELNRGTSVVVEQRSPNQIQVPAMALDGRSLAKGQWVELEIPQIKTTPTKTEEITRLQRNRITLVNPDSFTVDLQDEILESQPGKPIRLRLLTTYTTQADYPNPVIPSKEAVYAVYLDVWQRHVTALDDRQLQEVALNGLDTTTRLKTIAQVKLLDITQDLKQLSEDQAQAIDGGKPSGFDKKPSLSDLTALPAWEKLTRRAVQMTATTASDPQSPIDLSGNYRGSDNRLYRVEIHQGGALSEATFKWSRDNGSIVSAIERIEGDIVYLKESIQDEYNLFGALNSSQSKENPWVEIITDEQELNNQPGVLVRIRDVKPPNLLLLDMSQIQGAALPKANSEQAAQAKLKVRRWDGQSSIASGWQPLEQGIQVQFSADQSSADKADFKTGDYWLISARANRPIDWTRDLPQPKQSLGRPLPQPPDGIQHRYGILAVVKTQPQDGQVIFTSPIEQDDANWTQADLRTQFLPLIDRSSSTGIGVQQSEARFHVRGDSSQTAKGKIRKINDAPPTIEISETEARIFKGYTLSIGSKTAQVVEASGTSAQRLTLDTALDVLPEDQETPFRYQQPVIRFETQTAAVPQFFLSGAGNVGINTFQPAATLEIRESATNPAIDLIQVKNAAGTSLLSVQPDGKVGIGIDPPQANLDVQNILKITAAASSVQIQPQNDFVRFTSNKGYRFDNPLTIVSDAAGSGFLTVQPQTSNPVRFTANAGYSFNTATNSGFFGVRPQDGGAIEFTSNQGYRFDKTITVADGSVRVTDNNQENVTLNRNGINIANGKLTVAKGNIEIQDGVLKIGSFTISKDGIDSDDTNFNSITVRNRINFGGAALLQMQSGVPRFAPAIAFGNQVTFGDRATFNDEVTIKEKGLTIERGDLTLAQNNANLSITGNNANLSITGNKAYFSVGSGATIGKAYLPQPDQAPENGLLVQGHVGIGLFTPPPGRDSLLAKLHVQGANKARNAAALNITDSDGQSLLCVTNDGFVAVGTNDDAAPLGNNNIPPSARDAKLFVNGKIFGRRIEGTTIEQVSSATLKDNIADLSSQEAAELLKQLNPVKFNYIFPEDSTDHAGFIAEQVPPLLASPDRQAVRLLDIVAVLTKTVKDQRKGIAMLNQVVKQQQEAIATLTQKVSQIESSGSVSSSVHKPKN